MVQQLKKLGSRYSLVLPTATRVRKIGATNVALNVGAGEESSMVHRQMSHTQTTSQLHYEAIVGDKHAACAFRTRETLRNSKAGNQPSEEEEKCKKPKRRKRTLFTPEETESISLCILHLTSAPGTRHPTRTAETF